MALLTTTQAASQLSLSPATVRKMFDNGTIRGKWLGTRRMIPEEALTELIPLAEIDEDRAILAATTTAVKPLAEEIDKLHGYIIDLQRQFNGFRGYPGIDRINEPTIKKIVAAFNGLKQHVTNETAAHDLTEQITKLSKDVGKLTAMVGDLQKEVRQRQAQPRTQAEAQAHQPKKFKHIWPGGYPR